MTVEMDPAELKFEGQTLPIRADLAAELSRAWARLGRAGTWFNAERRLLIASEARRAKSGPLREQARRVVSPEMLNWRDDGDERLSPMLLEAVRRIAVDPGRLSPSWIRRILEEGVADVEYVEMVGVVITVITIDTFRRGLGSQPLPPPEPQPGEPTRVRPTGAVLDETTHAVPTVPPDAASGPLAAFYDAHKRDENPPDAVVQALSLVPDEVISWFGLTAATYGGVAVAGTLDRAQIELVAARSSALNGCFY